MEMPFHRAWLKYIFKNNFINFLPNDKILNLSNLKACEDDKITVIQEIKFVLSRIGKIVGKGENAGYQHFLLFPVCKSLLSQGRKSQGLFGKGISTQLHRSLNLLVTRHHFSKQH